ncbi:MAG: hypothetical protein DMF78_10370 [Acidobacteria bacterium]|nr:MAG: hypothetical protein DMF78_10370 [Acidobacteriota bacterium]
MADDLRARLDAMSTADLVAVFRSRNVEEWRAEVFPLVEEILARRRVDVDGLKAARAMEFEKTEYAPVESVASFSTALEANLCRMALEEAQIRAWLSTEYLADVAPHLGLAIGVDVLVRKDAAEAAREVLASIKAGAAAMASEVEPCPKCQSDETDRLPATDRASTIGAGIVAGIPLPQHDWRWKCRSCGHQWE